VQHLENLVALSSHMRILYAEDDLELRETTASIFQDLRFEVDLADNGKEALEKYLSNPLGYDIVITDLNMPYMGGMELIKRIQGQHFDQAIIVISAHNETEFFLESIRNNVLGYILKPIDFEQLIETLYKACSTVQLRIDNESYKTKLQEMVEEKTVELKQSYEKMHEFLTIDKTTKLHNATMLYHFIDTLPKNKEMTVMLYSIDDLNGLSQIYGIETTEFILSQISEFLHFNISKEVSLFKYNPDEFVLIFEKNALDPLFFATQMQSFLKETSVFEYECKPVYVTLSCGISSSATPSLLLPYARTALKEAHFRGLPNQYSYYDETVHSIEEDKTQSSWMQKIREALEEDRVIPVVHPVVDNTTKAIFSYECLARIEEEGVMISPIYFLEATRRSGLMCNLTRTMINKCFKLFADTHLLFSINITNEDLINPSFIDFITRKQEQYGIKPERVILEILEDIILGSDHTIPLQNLHLLKTLGYKIALDDFGSDRSNFNRFEHFSVDILKIDGQFIRSIDTNERNQTITSSIVTMAHKMGIKVVAEFVGTQAEFETVARLGVDYSQGYLFYKPSKTH
jgi:EAL domain-containing protein (putative c-di-GMP-specific phosphodiesterase class I)/PleD family two-component response regulator